MRNPEHNLQVLIVNILRANKIFCFAVPNGGRRDAVTGAKLKQEGVIAGASDLVVIMPQGKVLFVELKNGKTGRQSPEQKQFAARLAEMGHKYEVWRTIDDAVNFCKGAKQ